MAWTSTAQTRSASRTSRLAWRLPVAGALLGVALGAAACSSSTPVSSATVSPSAKVAAVESAKLGHRILTVDGRAVYVHLTTGGVTAPCTGACIDVWPPVDVSGVPSVQPGVHPSLVGVTAVAGGTKIMTYDGRPVYYFSGDDSPTPTGVGITSFGGSWYAVSVSGAPIDAAGVEVTGSAASSASSAGPSY
ncbi:hypothetical protein [Aciditerrimonas ferrireducens]|jgi:predicted lipoprotein with Yx(FWY)xxD motif|uniref:hypothetical protein n=1 Tax=Aciditerrimonas ferrireducens TaxID=667306 RepID=UPI0020065A37|nr:hypothetical protein [Aciditerrimonas ferrireducens]MCK4177698.1 hypothetical protein [Aciditerrimonas ferrireducens]